MTAKVVLLSQLAQPQLVDQFQHPLELQLDLVTPLMVGLLHHLAALPLPFHILTIKLQTSLYMPNGLLTH